ncbi:hypothetical protein V6N12_052004 [Hibiscus sabdariffa]|uniref:Uncharacterized protein n=1 Tax=Hibiscus sabdariffa TaxID=183260 RepID=A0ABR2GGZ3_9ROSI
MGCLMFSRKMATIRFDPTEKHYATSSLAVDYALCSSLLAVINKFAITKFNYPGLLTALQCLTCALEFWVLGKFGFLHHDPFTLDIAKSFCLLLLLFYLATFTDTNLLLHANVELSILSWRPGFFVSSRLLGPPCESTASRWAGGEKENRDAEDNQVLNLHFQNFKNLHIFHVNTSFLPVLLARSSIFVSSAFFALVNNLEARSNHPQIVARKQRSTMVDF